MLNSLRGGSLIQANGAFKVAIPDIDSLSRLIEDNLSSEDNIKETGCFVGEYLMNLLDRDQSIEVLTAVLDVGGKHTEFVLALFEFIGIGGNIELNCSFTGETVLKAATYGTKLQRIRFPKVCKVIEMRQAVSKRFLIPLFSFSIDLNGVNYDENSDLSEINLESITGKLVILPRKSAIIYPACIKALYTHSAVYQLVEALQQKGSFTLYKLLIDYPMREIEPTSIYSSLLVFKSTSREDLVSPIISNIYAYLPFEFIEEAINTVFLKTPEQGRSVIFKELSRLLDLNISKLTLYLHEAVKTFASPLSQRETCTFRDILLGKTAEETKKMFMEALVDKVNPAYIELFYLDSVDFLADSSEVYLDSLCRLNTKKAFPPQIQKQLRENLWFVPLEHSENTFGSKFVTVLNILKSLEYSKMNSEDALKMWVFNQELKKFNSNAGLEAILGLIALNISEDSVKYLSCLLEQPTWAKDSLFSFFVEDSLTFKNTFPKGLVNQGCTCYFNALVQSIFHLPALKEGIHSLREDSDFTRKMSSLFAKMEFGSTPFVNPISALNTIEINGEPINPSRQMDANELYQTFLNQYARFKEHDPFTQFTRGELEIRLECLNCGFVRDSKEDLYSIQVDINGEDKLTNLIKETEEEHFKGQNKLDCTNCDQQTEHCRTSKIGKINQYLVVVLKRIAFSYITGNLVKKNEKIVFDKDLIICGEKLQLDSVVIHTGSAYSGHYYTYIAEEGEFKEINDKNTYDRTTKEMENEAFGGENTTKSAYMLFYKKEGAKESADTSPEGIQAWNEAKFTKNVIFSAEFASMVVEIVNQIDTEEVNLLAAKTVLFVETRKLKKKDTAFALLNALKLNKNKEEARKLIKGYLLDKWDKIRVDSANLLVSELALSLEAVDSDIVKSLSQKRNLDMRLFFLSDSEELFDCSEGREDPEPEFSDNLVKAAMERKHFVGVEKVREDYLQIVRLVSKAKEKVFTEESLTSLFSFENSKLYANILSRFILSNSFENKEFSILVRNVFKKVLSGLEISSNFYILTVLLDFGLLTDKFDNSRRFLVVKLILSLIKDNLGVYSVVDTLTDLLLDLTAKIEALPVKLTELNPDIDALIDWYEKHPIPPVFKPIPDMKMHKLTPFSPDEKATTQKILACHSLIRHH